MLLGTIFKNMDEFYKKLTHNELLNHKGSPNHKIKKITCMDFKKLCHNRIKYFLKKT